ncbi:Uncharacterised protein [Klebsiella pneumoniae]|nr:Uncharacterised protein [Klebsiella pneumoniae]
MRVRCAVKFGYKKAPDYTEAGLLVGFGLLPFASCKVRIGCIVILFPGIPFLIRVFGDEH